MNVLLVFLVVTFPEIDPGLVRLAKRCHPSQADCGHDDLWDPDPECLGYRWPLC